MNQDLQGIFPVAPGPPPPEQQVQEQVEPLQQVVAEPYGCAVLPRRFTEARPVLIGDWFARFPAPTVPVSFDGVVRDVPIVDVPRVDLWGVELLHEQGAPTLAAYYWGNVAGYQWFAYQNRETADKLAEFLLLRQEEGM